MSRSESFWHKVQDARRAQCGAAGSRAIAMVAAAATAEATVVVAVMVMVNDWMDKWMEQCSQRQNACREVRHFGPT